MCRPPNFRWRDLPALPVPACSSINFPFSLPSAFSGASLGLTLFMMWTVARSQAHLLIWSAGLVFIVVGVVFFGWIIDRYSDAYLFWSFIFLTIGFGLLCLGSEKFCSGRTNLTTPCSSVPLARLPCLSASGWVTRASGRSSAMSSSASFSHWAAVNIGSPGEKLRF